MSREGKPQLVECCTKVNGAVLVLVLCASQLASGCMGHRKAPCRGQRDLTINERSHLLLWTLCPNRPRISQARRRRVW